LGHFQKFVLETLLSLTLSNSSLTQHNQHISSKSDFKFHIYQLVIIVVTSFVSLFTPLHVYNLD